jgi:hypothetical protein
MQSRTHLLSEYFSCLSGFLLISEDSSVRRNWIWYAQLFESIPSDSQFFLWGFFPSVNLFVGIPSAGQKVTAIVSIDESENWRRPVEEAGETRRWPGTNRTDLLFQALDATLAQEQPGESSREWSFFWIWESSDRAAEVTFLEVSPYVQQSGRQRLIIWMGMMSVLAPRYLLKEAEAQISSGRYYIKRHIFIWIQSYR